MYFGVIFHETEEGYKVWRGNDLLFQDWHKEYYKFRPKHSNFWKISSLMGSFWANYMLFEWKSREELYFMTLKSDAKFEKKSDSLLGKWRVGLGKFSQEHSKVSKLELCWNPFAQSRNFMTLQKSYESWQWRMIQKLKRNWHFILKLT